MSARMVAWAEFASGSGLLLSEVEFKAQLQLARANGSVGNLPEAWVVYRSIRGAEYRMVEGGFGLEANFEVHGLAEEELLSQG